MLSCTSNEQRRLLDIYVTQLLKWNAHINLISRADEGDIRTRHIEDSLALMEHLPLHTDVLVDFGSGSGLPAIVLALMTFAGGEKSIGQIHIIESNNKKISFMREVLRLTNTHAGADVTLHCRRIEDVAYFDFLHGKADIITARAFASLDEILRYGAPFAHEETIYLLHKGKKLPEEERVARKRWSFDMRVHPSSLPDAYIAEISKR